MKLWSKKRFWWAPELHVWHLSPTVHFSNKYNHYKNITSLHFVHQVLMHILSENLQLKTHTCCLNIKKSMYCPFDFTRYTMLCYHLHSSLLVKKIWQIYGYAASEEEKCLLYECPWCVQLPCTQKSSRAPISLPCPFECVHVLAHPLCFGGRE